MDKQPPLAIRTLRTASLAMAQCIRFRPSSAVASTVAKKNLPDTCASCHSNQQFLSRHNIPFAHPVELYRQSVHGRAVLEWKRGCCKLLRLSRKPRHPFAAGCQVQNQPLEYSGNVRAVSRRNCQDLSGERAWASHEGRRTGRSSMH